MIIVKLIGGLGNQMFQYALGRHLAYKHKTSLQLDISEFENYKLHKYSLKFFNIHGDDSEKFKKGFKKKIIAFFNSKKEPHFHFSPKILNSPDNVYLDGYWQSEKYFKDIEPIVRQEFTLKDKFNAMDDKALTAIGTSESVSLHIRRADYVTREKTNQVHGVCSLEYYHEAIAKIVATVKNPYFFIFSDDMPWAKDNLQLNFPVSYIDHGPDKNYEDLILMSRCKHNIIANSSFSWWGAWLNTNPFKIVIAPKKWFNDQSKNTKDLIPDGWIIL